LEAAVCGLNSEELLPAGCGERLAVLEVEFAKCALELK